MNTEQANNSYNKAIYKEIMDNPLPPMTLRIGVAGHRDLSEVDMKRLREEIEETYEGIYKAVQFIATDDTDDIAKSIYAKNTTPVIRIISSLAEGADRLCIPDKVPFEYELACILPFPATKFIRGFSPGKSITNPELDSVTEFYAILERIGYYRKGRHGYYNRNAPVIELDGNSANHDEAYNNCSRLLVEHSDILIAVYDGNIDKDVGTAVAVKAAMQKGIPVIHISTLDTTRKLHCSNRFGHAPNDHTPLTKDLLLTELRRVLLFSDIFEQSKTDNTKESIARKKKILAQFKRYHGGDNLHFAADADIDFDNMGPIELKNRYRNFAARAYDCLKWVITIVTPKRIQAELDTLKDKDTGAATTEAPKNIKSQFSKPSLNKYFAAYLRADRLANYYARSHRSTFVLIYLLGAAALITAACALAFKGEKTVLIFTGEEAVLICILLELVFLATICCLYLQDHRWKYHDRWLEYRCLAEFFRPMCYLSLLGRPYTISSFRDTAEYLDRKIIGHSAIGRSWLYIYTESINRWAGFNTCRLDSHCRQSVNHFITTTWLNGQINYHTHNAAVMRVLGKNLGQLSFGLFITTVICVILKLITVGIDLVIGSETAPDFITYLLALGAAILPILATTAYAIRNHAEFDISAQRSLTMRAALIFRRKKLNVNQTTLTSSQMTDILDEIATITIKETADWLEIYEVKESELG